MVHVEVHKVTGAALGPATAAEAGGGYTLRAAKPLRNGIKHTEIRSAKPTLVARGLSSCYGPQAATAAEPEGLLPCRSSVTPCSTWRQFLTFRKISQLGNRNAVQLSALTRLSTATAGRGSEIGRPGWILRVGTCSAAPPINTRVAASCVVVYLNQPRENEKYSQEFMYNQEAV